MAWELESQRASYERTRQILFSAVKKRRPFSLVRIGDGESVILAPQHEANPELEYHLKLWFGEPLPSPRRVMWLRSHLWAACRRASVLGIPTLRQRGLHPRYATTYGLLGKSRITIKPVICADAAVHRFLHLSGDLVACLTGAPFIGLVTSRNVLSPVVKACRPRQIYWHMVPPESPDPCSSEPKLRWFPHFFAELQRELRPPYRGAVYLVGAGLMGKLICEYIRSRGGIALDLGSVFDGWAEEDTRNYLERDLKRSYTLDAVTAVAQLSEDQRLIRLLELLNSTEEAPESFLLLNP